MKFKRYSAERFRAAYNPTKTISYKGWERKPNGFYIAPGYADIVEEIYFIKHNGKLFCPDESDRDWIMIKP